MIQARMSKQSDSRMFRNGQSCSGNRPAQAPGAASYPPVAGNGRVGR